MEKFLLNNMTKILFSFGCIVFLTWLFQFLNITFLNPINLPFIKEYIFEGIISTQYMFTTIGAIFAFWYGYKRYERDKEIASIDKYLKLNKEIRKDLEDVSFIDERDAKRNIYNKSLYLWHEEFFLKSKSYISDELWLIIKSWIRKDIKLILTRDLIAFERDESINLKQSPLQVVHQYCTFLQSVGIFTQEKEEIRINGSNFHEMIFDEINNWYIEVFEDERWKVMHDEELSILFKNGIKKYIDTFKKLNTNP